MFRLPLSRLNRFHNSKWKSPAPAKGAGFFCYLLRYPQILCIFAAQFWGCLFRKAEIIPFEPARAMPRRKKTLATPISVVASKMIVEQSFGGKT